MAHTEIKLLSCIADILAQALTICASIGLYRENAIAIECESWDPNGGNVFFCFQRRREVTMQITYLTGGCLRERNVICIVTYTSPPKTNTHYRRLGS